MKCTFMIDPSEAEFRPNCLQSEVQVGFNFSTLLAFKQFSKSQLHKVVKLSCHCSIKVQSTIMAKDCLDCYKS